MSEGIFKDVEVKKLTERQLAIKKWYDLHKDKMNCKWNSINRKRMSIEQAYRRVELNYAILMNFEKNLKKLASKEESKKEHSFYVVYLANFLSSCKAFLVNLRYFMVSYKKTAFDIEYSKKRESLFNDGLSKFMNDLRNLIDHDYIPDFLFIRKYLKEDIKVDIATKVEGLRKLKSKSGKKVFTGKSNIFLKNQNNTFVLTESVTLYLKKFSEFTDWFLYENGVFHQKEIDEYNKIIKKQNNQNKYIQQKGY